MPFRLRKYWFVIRGCLLAHADIRRGTGNYERKQRMFAGLRNALLLLVCLLCATGQARAVALGKIDVTSHLGETFYAEVPIRLDADEKIADVTIDLATPADYQILEVFRDASLNELSVELKDDARGPRAVISSTEAMNTPYFNLVLKLHYGHATNFRKYPVFLDLSEKMRPPAVSEAPAEQAAEPSVSAISQQPSQNAVPAKAAATANPAQKPGSAQPTSGFKPYAGWARIGRYGPMVRGDTISTVAERLPVDNRFTLNQIMVGLYNKNKSKFRENNINLIDAGSYLDVPTAAEIQSVSDDEARRILREQNKRWEALKKQPVYAAEAEAQKNRYRTRVRVGEAASGAPSASVASTKSQTQAATSGQAAQQKQAGNTAQPAQETGMATQLQDLQKENLQLKQELQTARTATASSLPETADAAAAEARAKKLQVSVVRLQQQILRVNKQLREMQSQSQNAQVLIYALGGAIVLLMAIVGYLLFLLRRVRPHPADASAAAEATDAEKVSSAGEHSDEPSFVDDPMDYEALAASLDSVLQHKFAGNDARDETGLPENEEPNPAGIDYLAEAEVYLRYGMEDEALQQVKRAIVERPDNLQAHIKLVELLRTLGDEPGMTAAIEAARASLNPNDLEAFESFLSFLPDRPGGAARESAGESGAWHPDAGEAELISGPDTQEEGIAPAEDGESEVGEAGEEAVVDFSSGTLADQEAGDAGLHDADADVDEVSSEGLDFIPGKDEAVESSPVDASEETMARDESNDHAGLEFELPDESTAKTGESALETGSHDGMGLSFRLPDESADEQRMDFDSATKEGATYLTGLHDEVVPETAIDAELVDDDLGEILSEFDDPGNADVETEVESEEAVADASADLSDVADMPETDVSNELDDLLAEWDKGEDEITVDAGPGNLEVDRARSLLAEGSLDDAEAALQSALDGERRGDALIGLAEVAAKRGDEDRKAELLNEAEPLVNASNRDWFDSVKNLSA